jgi:hypothetical protein
MLVFFSPGKTLSLVGSIDEISLDFPSSFKAFWLKYVSNASQKYLNTRSQQIALYTFGAIEITVLVISGDVVPSLCTDFFALFSTFGWCEVT